MSKNKKLAAEVVTACFVVLAISGLLLLNRTYQTTIDDKEAEIATLRSAQSSVVADEPLGDDAPTQENQIAVAFTPNDLFDEAEKAEIMTKLIQPYIDYEKDIANPNKLASIHVRHPSEGEVSTNYVVDIIYQNDSYTGFMYGDSTTKDQPWWQPQCLETCNFSEAYQQKYPAVVMPENEEE